jgi:ATPase family AAA domain-containing protein 3A/B
MWRLVRASAATAAVTAAAVSAITSDVAYADGRFFFPSRAPAAPPAGPAANVPGSHSSDQSGSSTASSSGFDPEALERGAKALREINNSPLAKQVFDFMPK